MFPYFIVRHSLKPAMRLRKVSKIGNTFKSWMGTVFIKHYVCICWKWPRDISSSCSRCEGFGCWQNEFWNEPDFLQDSVLLSVRSLVYWHSLQRLCNWVTRGRLPLSFLGRLFYFGIGLAWPQEAGPLWFLFSLDFCENCIISPSRTMEIHKMPAGCSADTSIRRLQTKKNNKSRNQKASLIFL